VKKRHVIINTEKFKNIMAVWYGVLLFSHKGVKTIVCFLICHNTFLVEILTWNKTSSC